ncbi:MAG: PAS domain S-box protein [Myxococcales bacterium]|nr:PAS domain S-box protein [Myxococcales bacterium]
MVGPLRRLLAAPTFAEEEDTRIAGILHTILVMAAAIAAVAWLLQLLMQDEHRPIVLVYPALVATSVALLAVVRRGRLQLAGTVFLLSLWAAINLGALAYGGIRSPTAGGHILVVIIATLLFSGRLVLVFVALSLTSLAGILAVELLGWLPSQAAPDTPEAAFIAHFVNLFGAGFFLYLGVKNLQDARRRARHGATKAAELLVEATAAKKYVDNILASMAESLVVLDPGGVILTVNKATLDLLGHDAATLLGQHFRVVMPDFGTHTTDTAPAVGTHEPVERAYIHRDGTLVPVLFSHSRLPGEHGASAGSVCVASDITQLKQAEHGLREAKQLAEEASLAKSRFLANMSHELRTPLNAVIGYAEMLLEEADERRISGSAEEIRKVQLAGKHLLGLISDILDLSKIEAGRMDIHLETFDVADMIDVVLGTVGPMIARNGNEISVACPPSIGFIHADLTKFRQILLNLLSNAAKFTDKGTIRVSVSRLLQGTQQYIQFVVADTGIGMTQGQVAQLFQAFSQGDTSTSRRYGGTGLGLAITKAFTDMLGGSIEVQSKLGSGTAFVVRLPFINPRDLSGSKRAKNLDPDIAEAARAAALRAGLLKEHKPVGE